MRTSCFCAAAAALLLIAADKPRPAPKGDQARLQGAWKVTAGESNGKPAPEDAIKEARLVFKGDTVTATGENGKTHALTFKLNTAGKLKTIDLTSAEKKQTLLGIYGLDGDSLTICLGPPGGDRPTRLATKEGSPSALFKLRREKP